MRRRRLHDGGCKGLAFTVFYRDQQVLERVVEHALPSLAGRSHPRIRDAGPAMGQEPYTLCMMFADRTNHFASGNLRIDATDVERQFAQIILAPPGGDSQCAGVPQTGERPMRILNLESSGKFYTCQVYLVLGSESRLEDVKRLVDVGRDAAILASIERAPTRVGKWPVDQVVLTRVHSDHSALLPRIREVYHPGSVRFLRASRAPTRRLRGGETIKMGGEDFEVIQTPGHSSDSICLYNRTEGVLFSGDSPLLSASATGTYEAGFLAALDKICARDVRRICGGDGSPVTERCNERLGESHRMAAGARKAIGTSNQAMA